MTEKDKQIQEQAIRIRELENDIAHLLKLLDRMCEAKETPESPYKAWKLMRDEHESTDS